MVTAIMIPAHNEQTVLARSLGSLRGDPGTDSPGGARSTYATRPAGAWTGARTSSALTFFSRRSRAHARLTAHIVQVNSSGRTFWSRPQGTRHGIKPNP